MSDGASPGGYGFACGCDCGDWEPDTTAEARSESLLLASDGWIRCECDLCGLSGHGCQQVVSVLIKLKTSWQRGDRTIQSDDPAWCGGCSDHHLLLRRQKAVRNMQAKRKRAGATFYRELAPISEHPAESADEPPEESASKEQPEKATCK